MFGRNKEKRDFDDDGRTVADMNIDGMPWYVEKNTPQNSDNPQSEPIELTPEENRAFIGGVVKASILIALIFAVGAFLFILFCVFVWFK